MNRRNFLSLVGASAAALIAPELLIPKRTFFLPPAGGWAQPSIASLWLDYVNQIRPAGILVTASACTLRKPGVYERPYGHVELVVPEESDRELIARMRAALTQPPKLRNVFYPTMEDFYPWVERA
jgi:hypothetical protein